MKSKFVTAFCSYAFFAFPASADPLLDTANACNSALRAGDRAGFEDAADKIMSWRFVFHTQAQKAASECLSKGFAEPWEYDTSKGRFVSVASVAEERAAQEERRLAVAEQEKNERRKREIMLANLADAAARKAERKAENDLVVALAVYQACKDLLQDDRIAALTNSVCVASFKQNSLPEY